MKAIEKPGFLSKREWEAVMALKRGSKVEISLEENRRAAARAMGIKTHSLENLLARIRRKVDDAKTFNRRYRETIRRLR